MSLLRLQSAVYLSIYLSFITPSLCVPFLRFFFLLALSVHRWILSSFLWFCLASSSVAKLQHRRFFLSLQEKEILSVLGLYVQSCVWRECLDRGRIVEAVSTERGSAADEQGVPSCLRFCKEERKTLFFQQISRLQTSPLTSLWCSFDITFYHPKQMPLHVS